jgi:DNA-binding MarR family transcriptional regulator
VPTRAAPDDVPALELLPHPLEGVDELSAQVFRAFHATLRLHKRLMTRTLAAHGTHPGQAICLRLLAAHDGITQRDLAQALQLSPPTVSKMLSGLERTGAVERRPDAADQRLTRVFLTAQGRALELALRGVSAGHINETIGALSEDDRRELCRLLDGLGVSIARALARHEAEDVA